MRSIIRVLSIVCKFQISLCGFSHIDFVIQILSCRFSYAFNLLYRFYYANFILQTILQEFHFADPIMRSCILIHGFYCIVMLFVKLIASYRYHCANFIICKLALYYIWVLSCIFFMQILSQDHIMCLRENLSIDSLYGFQDTDSIVRILLYRFYCIIMHSNIQILLSINYHLIYSIALLLMH